ncbi:MAG: aminoacyl-tRNA hydrolase [Acidimicrobiia bacterium]
MARTGRNGERSRTGTPADLLVVGLGNPGREYDGTRHNVGFDVVDLLVTRHGGRLRAGKERALVDEVRIDTRRVALAEPTTFMNLSGESVAPLVRRYGIVDLARLVIVHDDLDLPVGEVRLKLGGGLAGHNGLRSIHQRLHSADFVRLRIGVGRPPSAERGADHVLSKVGRADRGALDDAVARAADAVELLLEVGLDAAMNRVNTKSTQ